MSLNYSAVRNWSYSEPSHTYTQRDTMLYALGVGLGADPIDERELRFVYEKELLALPTMSAVLCHHKWISKPEFGIDWLRVVHAEHKMTFSRALPASGSVSAEYRNLAVVDKGLGKGALIYQEKRVLDQGSLISTTHSSYFARGDGGFSIASGVSDAPRPPPRPMPDTAPHVVRDCPTLPHTPLIYRLSGDYMPIHADPEAARKAGFPRPILHGLCTYAMAGIAIIKTYCEYDPARLASLSARFSKPALPGETIRTELWQIGENVLFRSRAVGRDAIVLNNGEAQLR